MVNSFIGCASTLEVGCQYPGIYQYIDHPEYSPCIELLLDVLERDL